MWEVDRFCRRTGRRFPSLHSENEVQSAGKYDFLDLMFYTNSPTTTDQFDNGSTEIEVGTSNYVVSCKSGYPSHPGSPDFGICYWWFEDLTSNSYDASTIDFYNADSSTIFSIDSSTGWGTKPSSENWIYKYTLILQSSDSDFDDEEGLDHAMMLFTGNGGRFAYTDGWTADHAELYVQNSGRTVSRSVYVEAGYPSRSGTTVTLNFVENVGQGTGQDWFYVQMRTAATTTPGSSRILSETTEDAGTKGASEEFDYTYTFTLT